MLILDGYRERQRVEAKLRQELTAWQTAWLLAPHSDPNKDPITADTLLGRKSRRPRPHQYASPVAAMDAFFSARAAQSKQERHDGE